MDADSARHSPLRAWKKQICVAVHGSGLTTLACGEGGMGGWEREWDG